MPDFRRNEALSFIQRGLDDVSLSRAKLKWGMPLPWDPSQRMYVWFDALLNYYTALGFAREGEDLTERFWPAAFHLLAKDILKFHAVIWPALLMAAEIEPPRGMVIHGYLMMGEKKMSKSLGNVLDPFEAIDRYGSDALRFYCLREVSFGQDGSVSAAGFESRYETELANDFGNLASRTLAMVDRYRDGVVPDAKPDPELSDGADGLDGLGAEVRDLIDRAEPSQALEAIWVRVRRVNRYVEETRPWDLAKDESSLGASRSGALQPGRGAPGADARRCCRTSRSRLRSSSMRSARRSESWRSSAREVATSASSGSRRCSQSSSRRLDAAGLHRQRASQKLRVQRGAPGSLPRGVGRRSGRPAGAQRRGEVDPREDRLRARTPDRRKRRGRRAPSGKLRSAGANRVSGGALSLSGMGDGERAPRSSPASLPLGRRGGRTGRPAGASRALGRGFDAGREDVQGNAAAPRDRAGARRQSAALALGRADKRARPGGPEGRAQSAGGGAIAWRLSPPLVAPPLRGGACLATMSRSSSRARSSSVARRQASEAARGAGWRRAQGVGSSRARAARMRRGSSETSSQAVKSVFSVEVLSSTLEDAYLEAVGEDAS